MAQISSRPLPKADLQTFESRVAATEVVLERNHLAEVYSIFGYIEGMSMRLAQGLSIWDEPAATFIAEDC